MIGKNYTPESLELRAIVFDNLARLARLEAGALVIGGVGLNEITHLRTLTLIMTDFILHGKGENKIDAMAVKDAIVQAQTLVENVGNRLKLRGQQMEANARDEQKNNTTKQTQEKRPASRNDARQKNPQGKAGKHTKPAVGATKHKAKTR